MASGRLRAPGSSPRPIRAEGERCRASTEEGGGDSSRGSRHRGLGIIDVHRTLIAFVVVLLASWATYALALDRQGAIDVAKRQVKSKCKSVTLCTFNARVENNKWYVRVDFATDDSPQDKPLSY